MISYRFRVSFEDYDEIIREIDMLPKHTFLDLHFAIHENLGYDPERSSSFYISNDQWKKGKEIAYLPSENKIGQNVSLMENSKLNQFIDDPHQKFYYTYNFQRPFDFHVQLIKIVNEPDDKNKKYPFVFKSLGSAPKPFNQTVIVEDLKEEEKEKEFDFLNELEYENEDIIELEEDDPEKNSDFSEGEEQDEDY